MQRIKVITALTRISWKIFSSTPGGYLQRINKVKKYTSLYQFHSQHQQFIYHQNLQLIRRQQHKESPSIGKYKDILSQYLNSRKKEIKEQIKDQYQKRPTTESLLQMGLKRCFQTLTLFYESLQALVEGRREVLQNDQFVFEDGKTVKQKQEHFQNYVSRLMGSPIQQDPEKSGQKETVSSQEVINDDESQVHSSQNTK